MVLSGPLALSQPIAIGNVLLSNRIVMAPITTNYGDERGYVTSKTLGFYGERARGGAAAIIFEALCIDATSRLAPRGYCIHDDSFVAGLASVVELVHGHGARIFAQLCHAGPKARSAITGAQALSASDVAVRFADPPRPMTQAEIRQAIDAFAAAALRARKAGFDGIELHAAHFYLLSAFLSGHLNLRADEYGGSVENRARLACEVIQAVKAKAGSDYPVICRIHGREALPRGIDEAEAKEIARLLVDAGADALHVSAGTAEVNPKIAPLYAIRVGGPPTKEMPFGCFVDCAASVKQAVDVPVIAVGKLNEPAVAERVLREKAADVIAIGRGLIADPYLPAKMLSGRWDEIVRCKDCLTCHTTMIMQRDMRCSVNPRPWEPAMYRAASGARLSEG